MSELSEIMRRRNAAGPIHGWSGTNPYVVNSLDPNAENNGEFNVQANFPVVTYYTVQFSLRENERSDTDGAEFSPRGIAEIHWTVKGNHHQRILHVANGTTISGAGEAVWVRFIDDTQIVTGEDNVPLGITAIISIVTGTRANAADSQPPMVVEDTAQSAAAEVDLPFVLPAGASMQLFVPRDHGVNSMMITAYAATAGAGIALLGNDVVITGGAAGVGLNWGADMLNRWIPIPPGNMRIEVTNNTAENVVVTCLWGIEG
jgi:hypothetical protein